MTRIAAGLLASLLTLSAFAQSTENPSGAAPAGSGVAPAQEPARPAPTVSLAPLYAFTKDSTTAGKNFSDFCDPTQPSSIPMDAMVVVVGKKECTSRFGKSFAKTHYEVIFNGNHLFVKESDLAITAEDVAKALALTPVERAANDVEWTALSKSATKMQFDRAMLALFNTSKQGVAILEAGVFDVSEHTEGTGYEVRVMNTSKKTIKYITFNVVGMNAVKDPVRGRIGGGTTVSLRGVGPIEPDTSAKYSKDYMWHTDLVEYSKLQSVKVEYMDGTQKTLTGLDKLRLSRAQYAMLMAYLE